MCYLFFLGQLFIIFSKLFQLQILQLISIYSILITLNFGHFGRSSQSVMYPCMTNRDYRTVDLHTCRECSDKVAQKNRKIGISGLKK